MNPYSDWDAAYRLKLIAYSLKPPSDPDVPLTPPHFFFIIASIMDILEIEVKFLLDANEPDNQFKINNEYFEQFPTDIRDYRFLLA